MGRGRRIECDCVDELVSRFSGNLSSGQDLSQIGGSSIAANEFVAMEKLSGKVCA